MLLLARTTPLSEVDTPGPVAVLYGPGPVQGGSPGDRENGSQGRGLEHAVHRRAAHPVADRVGEEGRGFEYILHGLNPERILIAAEAVGIGRAALERAVRCRRARSVRPPDRPEPGRAASAGPGLDAAGSGRPDGIQGGQPVRRRQALRPRRELGKYLAAEAGYNACQTAVMTLGGMGYAKGTTWNGCCASFIPRIAPVSPQLIPASSRRKCWDCPSPIERGATGRTVGGLRAAAGRPQACRSSPAQAERRMLAYSACLVRCGISARRPKWRSARPTGSAARRSPPHPRWIHRCS